MEFGNLGDLLKLGSNIQQDIFVRERFALHVLFQMSLALQYMHSNLIVHRDIKPDNITLNSAGIFKVRGRCRNLPPLGSAATSMAISHAENKLA
eukprot:3805140-Pyramimonas_sp.AAC.1